MSFPKTVIALALLAAAPLAVAQSDIRFVGGEVGYADTHDFKGTKTRDEVRQELADSQRHPVSSNGLRFVGGEQGYVDVTRWDQMGSGKPQATMGGAPAPQPARATTGAPIDNHYGGPAR